MHAELGRLVLAQKGGDPLIVQLGRVDLVQDVLVPIAQHVDVHLGHDVGRTIHVVARQLEMHPSLVGVELLVDVEALFELRKDVVEAQAIVESRLADVKGRDLSKKK